MIAYLPGNYHLFTWYLPGKYQQVTQYLLDIYWKLPGIYPGIIDYVLPINLCSDSEGSNVSDIYLVVTLYILDNLQLYHDTMFKSTITRNVYGNIIETNHASFYSTVFTSLTG